MPEHLTTGEFERFVDRLRDDLRDGFRGVHTRLDTLNGQTRRHGEAIAAHEARLLGLDREMRDVKRGRPLVPEGMSKRKAVSWGVVALAALTLAQEVVKAGGAELLELLFH